MSLYEASFCRSTFIIFIKHVTQRIWNSCFSLFCCLLNRMSIRPTAAVAAATAAAAAATTAAATKQQRPQPRQLLQQQQQRRRQQQNANPNVDIFIYFPNAYLCLRLSWELNQWPIELQSIALPGNITRERTLYPREFQPSGTSVHLFERGWEISTLWMLTLFPSTTSW